MRCGQKLGRDVKKELWRKTGETCKGREEENKWRKI